VENDRVMPKPFEFQPPKEWNGDINVFFLAEETEGQRENRELLVYGR
jgi:hypothetical protein